MEFQQQQPFTPPPPPTDDMPPAGFTPPVSAVNPVVRAIKELGRSGLFLCLCIAQTVNALFQTVTGIQEAQSGSNGVEAAVFPILTTVAFWMIFAALRSDKTPFISTGGLKFVKVITTIQMVLGYIVGGVSLLAVLVLAMGVGMGGDPFDIGSGDGYLDDIPGGLDSFWEFEGSYLVAVMVPLLVVGTGLVVHGHLLRRGIATLTENCEGYLTDRSFPLYIIIECYVLAGVFLICGLNMLVNEEVLPAIWGMVAGATFGLGGVLMTRYRKKMEELRQTSMESAYFSQPTPPPFQNM